MSRLRISERGDTIVEVLIAIAIVSLVLGGAYVSARRSLQMNQRAAERVEASKVVEQQLEKLKTVAAQPDNDLFASDTTEPYCIDGSLVRQDNLNECRFGPDDGGSGRYQVQIFRDSSSDGRYVFNVRAQWDRLGGGDPQMLNAYYRVYP
ncbi:MAG: prepilin-type N-terminal cleavage/methylation domain-containing protein [Candidatus Saccharibacteria bacterium]|nr:prepilin-type N-terminal cleavage/methylation domain-containing protein [Candidatus Saccharibacteria bacterium]